jgi:PAS domain S-box-containing protein
MVEPIEVVHVDDDENYRALVSEQLQRVAENMTVRSVGTGSHSLDLLSEESVDCILADYRLPKMNGLELLSAVRERHSEIPYILYTGKGSEEVASDAIAAGVSDYVTKSMTTESWELLAQRIENAVEERRAKEQAQKSTRIADLVRAIQSELVHATDIESIDSAICETLVDAEPYVLAWIADYDADTDQVEIRDWCGVDEGYLDAIDVSAEESESGQGPTGTAIRTRSVTVVQDIQSDPSYEPWREAALERGFQSSAAVPLIYDGTLYGVLNLYADRPAAFESEEQKLLSELGATIGAAYHRVQIQERYRVQYQQLFQQAPDGIILHDLHGDILDVNRAICESLGYTHEELCSMNVSDVETGIEMERLGQAWQKLDPGETMKIEGRHERQDGSTFPVEVWVNKVEVSGEVRGLSLTRNITDRKARQQELQELKERLELAIEVANLGVWDWDVDQDRIEYNDQLANMFGYESTALSIGEMEARVHPEEREAVKETLNQHLAGETAYFDEEYRMRTADGDYKWVRNIGRVIKRDESRSALRAVGVYLDIDEQKHAELALERERDNLEVLNQIVRHDIRNYLQIVSLYAESLTDHIDEEGQDELERVQSSARRATEITQTAGDVAEVMLQAETDPEPVRFNSVLEREIAEVRSTYGDAVVDIEGTLPAVEVYADDMLESVFRNLLTNAIEHNDSDVPEVTVSVDVTDEFATFRIVDNGPGIPDARKSDIFEKGEKALESSGTGLGLYLVQTLVDRYEGDIWVEDASGDSQADDQSGGSTGAVFCVQLPTAE